MKKRVLATLLMAVMCVGLLSGCGGQAKTGGSAAGNSGGTEKQADGNTRDTLVVAIPDAPSYMDPQVQASIATYRVTTQIFDRLVSMDTDMNLVPSLAESWDVEDDKSTLFHLRKGVKFHNGEEMKAEDVKYSLERCIASSGVNYNYLIIDNIEVVDDYTVRIVTKEPFNALLYRLSLDSASIICKSADTSPEEFNQNPVGTGPFKFVSWELGGDVVLEAFDDYYNGAPQVKHLIFRQIPEAINRTIGLETGEVDLAYDLGITDLESLKGNDKIVVDTVPSTTVWYLGANVGKPGLDNVKVRQAIAYAINYQDVIDIAFSGVATPAHNTMLPSSLFGYAPDTVTYDYNVEKAKALLAEAGYPDGFKTTLWCADSQIMKDTSVVLQEQLRQVGIEAEVKTMEQGNYYSATGKGDHDLFIMSKTSIDPDSMLRAMYHTEAFGLSGNRSFWSSPEVDDKLNLACVTTDQKEAEALYHEVQTIVAEEVPVIPLAIEHLNAGRQADVKGFKLYPGKSHFIYGTYFEQ